MTRGDTKINSDMPKLYSLTTRRSALILQKFALHGGSHGVGCSCRLDKCIGCSSQVRNLPSRQTCWTGSVSAHREHHPNLRHMHGRTNRNVRTHQFWLPSARNKASHCAASTAPHTQRLTTPKSGTARRRVRPPPEGPSPLAPRIRQVRLRRWRKGRRIDGGVPFRSRIAPMPAG